MRLVGLLVCLVAACGNDRTDVQIVVHSPADFGDDPAVVLPNSVRLFVGMDESADDAWIAPEGFTRGSARLGAYWISEYESEPQVISPGNPAEFRFELDDRRELGIVVAVGYTNGRPTSSASLFHVTNEGSGFSRYPLGLNSAGDALDPAQRSRVNQLELWGTADNTCVHVENQRTDVSDTGHRTAFIVGDENDVDCDGFMKGDTKECSPTVYKGSRPPELGELSCVTSSGGGVCRLGGPLCVDGEGPRATGCERSRYCTTSAACANCTDLMCLRDIQSRAGGSIPGLALICDVYGIYDSETTAGTVGLCTTTATVTLPTNGNECTSIVAASRESGFDAALAWDDQRVSLSSVGCVLELSPSGTVVGTNVQKRGALFAVDLEGGKGFAIPAVFRFIPMPVATADLATACATSPLRTSCHLTTNEFPPDVAACLAQPPP